MSIIGHNSPSESQETIERNINRKKPILDREPQFFNGVPIPSWIELSLIDVCNRDCSFCPKSDESVSPNTYMKMEQALVEKLITDLKKINFEGSFTMWLWRAIITSKYIGYNKFYRKVFGNRNSN